MAVNKDFLEAVSRDEALKAELEQATSEAICEFLKEKGFDAEEVRQLTPEALGDFLRENDLEAKAEKVMEVAAERVPRPTASMTTR